MFRHGGEVVSRMLSAYVGDIHVLVFDVGNSCLPHDLGCFLHFPMLKICFLCCWANGKEWATILGFGVVVLLYGKPRSFPHDFLHFFSLYPSWVIHFVDVV